MSRNAFGKLEKEYNENQAYMEHMKFERGLHDFKRMPRQTLYPDCRDTAVLFLCIGLILGIMLGVYL